MQLHLYVTDEEGETIRRRAESLGLTVSRYLAEVIRREVATDWPKGYFEEVVGAWQGEPLERPSQQTAEVREPL